MQWGAGMYMYKVNTGRLTLNDSHLVVGYTVVNQRVPGQSSACTLTTYGANVDAALIGRTYFFLYLCKYYYLLLINLGCSCYVDHQKLNPGHGTF